MGDFLAEDAGPGLCAGTADRGAGLRVDNAYRVELVRFVADRWGVPVPLFGQRVHQYRSGELASLDQGFFHRGLVMPIDRANVLQTKIFE